MPKLSAGLLMYRHHSDGLQVLLVHPGGPFWKKKDNGAWTIPKGEADPGEDLLDTAKREFEEEIGSKPTGPFIQMSPVEQKGAKIVHAWAVEGNLDTTAIKSNTVTMEWPPRSSQQVEFPEIDRAEFFDLQTARAKINPAQVALLNELTKLTLGNASRNSAVPQ